MKQSITPYLEARETLPTFTNLTCVCRKFPYNLIFHTAILYKDPLTGQLKVFESTTLNKFTGISGVQLTPFGTWLAHYPGKVYARIPKFGDSDEYANQCRQELASDFILTNLGSSYPNLKTRTGRFKLYLAALDFKLFGKDWFTYTGKDDGIFCTELVIKMLQQCGLFQAYKYAHEYKPRDLRGNNEMFERLLVNMMYLPEIRLK